MDGVYDAAADATTTSASAAAEAKTVNRVNLFMAPSFEMSPGCSWSDAGLAGELYRENPAQGERLTISRHGRAADRGVRLGHRRADGAARMPRDDAARGLRLPRRSCAAAVRAATARRGSLVRARDRPLSRAPGGQARARRLQLGDLCGASGASGSPRRPGRRPDPAPGAYRRPGNSQPQDRLAGDEGNG